MDYGAIELDVNEGHFWEQWDGYVFFSFKWNILDLNWQKMLRMVEGYI